MKDLKKKKLFKGREKPAAVGRTTAWDRRDREPPMAAPYLITSGVQHDHLGCHAAAGFVVLERHVGLCELDSKVSGQGVTDAIPSKGRRKGSLPAFHPVHSKSIHPLKVSCKNHVRATA